MTIPRPAATICAAHGIGGGVAGLRLPTAIATLVFLGATLAPGALAGQAPVPATQQLAVLLTAHNVHRAPEAKSAEVSIVAANRPLTGEQTTLPVIGRATGPGAAMWLRVMLPGRPNVSTGWITEEGTTELRTQWRVVVDLAAREVIVYDSGRSVRALRGVVGKPSTPTPTGRFFVEETVQMPPGHAGGPLALALSARSNALQTFEGGPGQIAIHGMEGLGGTVGAAESHGCVRMTNADIDWLAAHIEPGVPVTIEANRRV
jgi:lipoprotein-anchoring transpeptidase ErfK/SrfK